MDARSHLKQGELASTTQKLVQDVKANPTNIQSRTLLFEVLCFAGEFKKAIRQLEVLESQDKPNELGIQVYKNLLLAEEKRDQVFSYGGGPEFFCPPSPYVESLLAAIKYMGESRYEEARGLLEATCQDWPNVSGDMNGQHFSSLRDCYDLLAPVLEVMISSQYYWVPWDTIKRLSIETPKYLRDLFWVQAKLVLREGQDLQVFVPVLYPRSFTSLEENVKLGRETIWEKLSDGVVVGKGQRLIEIDESEYPLLEIKTLEFT